MLLKAQTCGILETIGARKLCIALLYSLTASHSVLSVSPREGHSQALWFNFPQLQKTDIYRYRAHADIWKEAVKFVPHRNWTLTRQQMLGVQQELNVAYAGHEITAEPIEGVFDWFQVQPTQPSRLTVHGAYLPRPQKHVDERRLP